MKYDNQYHSDQYLVDRIGRLIVFHQDDLKLLFGKAGIPFRSDDKYIVNAILTNAHKNQVLAHGLAILIAADDPAGGEKYSGFIGAIIGAVVQLGTSIGNWVVAGKNRDHAANMVNKQLAENKLNRQHELDVLSERGELIEKKFELDMLMLKAHGIEREKDRKNVLQVALLDKVAKLRETAIIQEKKLTPVGYLYVGGAVAAVLVLLMLIFRKK